MTRIFAFLIAALFVVASACQVQAQGYPQGYRPVYHQGYTQDINQDYDPGLSQGFDSRDVMGGGPHYYTSAASPIPRTLVQFDSGYPPGSIIVNTAERRLYLLLPDGQALRYGI